MTRRRPRFLRPDEEELWGRIARTARPLAPERQSTLQKTADAKSAPAPKPAKPPQRLEAFEIGSRTSTSMPGYRLDADPSRPLSKTPLRMDRGAFLKMKRGKLVPDARIDLHGMTADAALSALTGFLFRAHSGGKRLALVITGKGRIMEDDDPVPARTGVLRQSVPNWLSRPPLSSIVLQIVEAHQKHGGSGAFYVYLRRSG